ncbi:hypothetical protein TanjilG_24988 [Lupinus angustifolius]|uniref:Uncharacterized protein n=1 Tax=Lupinus angustifolius TaxID=3871 RepID=A0A1J7HCS6_LUPAN|nr:hypothetical protein TanjilG_24988 [Lupinus angustifolius]
MMELMVKMDEQHAQRLDQIDAKMGTISPIIANGGPNSGHSAQPFQVLKRWSP